MKLKYQCPRCGTICNFNSFSVLKRCGKCNFIIEDIANEFYAKPVYCSEHPDCERCNKKCYFVIKVHAKNCYGKKPVYSFCCPNCKRAHICSNDEEVIRCECGNIIKNPIFQPIKRESIFEKKLEDIPFFKFIGCIIIIPLSLLFIYGCVWLFGPDISAWVFTLLIFLIFGGVIEGLKSSK